MTKIGKCRIVYNVSSYVMYRGYCTRKETFGPLGMFVITIQQTAHKVVS